MLALVLLVSMGQIDVYSDGAFSGRARNRINCTGEALSCSVSQGMIVMSATGGDGLNAPQTCGAGNFLGWNGGWTCTADSNTLPPSGACGANGWVSGLNGASAPTCTQPGFSNISGSVTDSQVPDTITVNLSAAATALASDPTDCAGNNFARGINASGTAQCAQPAFSNLSGSASIAQGGTTLSSSAEDAVLVGSGTTSWQAKVLPSCSNGTTSKLLYDSTANAFECGVDQSGGGGNRNTVTQDVSTSSSAADTSVSDLSISVAALTDYAIDCLLVTSAAATTTGVQLTLTGPSAPVQVTWTRSSCSSTTATVFASINAFGTRDSRTASAGTVRCVERLNAVLLNGDNAGTVGFGLRSEVGTSAVAVHAGSTCTWVTL